MTKEELTTLLHNPEQTGQSVDRLGCLIEDYPYFHTGHQLYLKALHQTDKTKMMFQLKRTALCIRDRDVLFHYINGTLPHADMCNIQTTSPIENLTDCKPLTSEEQHKTDDHLFTDEKTMNNNLINAIAHRPELIRTTRPEEKQQPPSETATSDVETAEMLADNTPVEIREKYTEEQLVADLLKISPKRNDISPPTFAQNHPEEKESGNNNGALTAENRRWSSAELIDFFLKTNPKIIRSDKQYEVDLSESLQDNFENATETLADIYDEQGHKDKAIEIYEHLILKYPEKHIYFAAQIERLKNKI